jgi:hypothetical protein
MNPIILIAAYQGYKARGDQDACRDTYLKEWGHLIPHRFVYDRDYKDECAPDEIIVDAPTGFMECVFKTHLGIRWALDNGYDHVFSAPTDCYIVIPRLLASGYEKLDYTGFQVPGEGHIGGGSGYWLSKRAMEIVVAAAPILDYEDRWVGQVTRAAGIKAVHDFRYRSHEMFAQKDAITMHLSHATGVYDPIWMRQYHTLFMDTGELI